MDLEEDMEDQALPSPIRVRVRVRVRRIWKIRHFLVRSQDRPTLTLNFDSLRASKSTTRQEPALQLWQRRGGPRSGKIMS